MEKQTFNTSVEVKMMAGVLGQHLKTARKRRVMTQQDVAYRIGVTREVIMKAERGDPILSHSLLSILWLYGLLHQSVQSVSDTNDVVGLSMEKSRLPTRIRKPLDEF